MKFCDQRGRFNKCKVKQLRNTDSSVVIEHNYLNTTLCHGQGECSSINCNNFHVKLPAGVSQNGWREGRRLVELGVLLDNLAFCSLCKLGPVSLTANNVVGELQKGLCGYLYVVCQNADCQFVNRVAYGKTHRQKTKGMPCFNVNTKLGTGNETWTKGFVNEDMKSELSVTNETLFNIGSISKSFTMSLLGILLDENGFNWTTKVHEILGPEKTFIDEYRTKEMTLRDLLSHRTGLANPFMGFRGGIPKEMTRAEYCKRLKFLPEEKPFRDVFLYNNYMYMYLGYVTEVLGKDKWDNLLESRLLRPLGMTSTVVGSDPSLVLKDGVARPYTFSNGAFRNGTMRLYSWHPFEPAGAIFSNGQDMAKYLDFILKNGNGSNGDEIVRNKLFTEAFKATSYDSASLATWSLTKPEFPVSDTHVGYGYAFLSSNYRGYTRVWHEGGFISYTSMLWTYPDLDIGIYGSVNGPGFKLFGYTALQTISYHISDYLLNENHWLNITTTCSFPQPWQKETKSSIDEEISVDIPNIAEYTGLFGNQYLPDFIISCDVNDNRKLNANTNFISAVLHTTSDKDRFLFEIKEPWDIAMLLTADNNVTFKPNVEFQRHNGQITSLQLKLDTTFTYMKGVSILDQY